MLDKFIVNLDDRTQVAYGSKNETHQVGGDTIRIINAQGACCSLKLHKSRPSLCCKHVLIRIQ